MASNEIKAIVLAAGKGTRMKSAKAKVLHEVFFAPMLHHVLGALTPLDLPDTVIVTGHQAGLVEESLAGFNVVFARQRQQTGTANAVLAAQGLFADFAGTILILCGDTPAVRTETLQEMLAIHAKSEAVMTVMTTAMVDPANYGRVVTDDYGNILRIVEEKDASPSEKMIGEINAGIYCVRGDFLFKGLLEIGSDNQQGEFYLTDLVAVARAAGLGVSRYVCKNPSEVLGINSRMDLAEAHKALRKRRNTDLMLAGVTIIDPESVDISFAAQIGADCEIGRNVVISGPSVLGRDCLVSSGSIIRNCRFGVGVRVEPHCCLADCDIDGGRLLAAGTILTGAQKVPQVCG